MSLLTLGHLLAVLTSLLLFLSSYCPTFSFLGLVDDISTMLPFIRKQLVVESLFVFLLLFLSLQ